MDKSDLKLMIIVVILTTIIGGWFIIVKPYLDSDGDRAANGWIKEQVEYSRSNGQRHAFPVGNDVYQWR